MSACETYAGVAGTRKELVTNDAMKNRRIVAELLLKAAAESGVDLVNLEANVSVHHKCAAILSSLCSKTCPMNAAAFF